MSEQPRRDASDSSKQTKRALPARLLWPLVALAVLAGVLVVAWIDGGEEPVRPIEQPVMTTNSENAE